MIKHRSTPLLSNRYHFVRLFHSLLIVLLALVFARYSAGQSNKTESSQVAFFETKIRPVLVQHCYECHAADAKEVHGGLLLDSREGIRRGGDSGVGIVPGGLDESLVLQAMRYESFEMPPTGPLPAHVIADFETWVQQGATDPRDTTGDLQSVGIDIEAAKQFWSFRPRVQVAPPHVIDQDWPESSVDLFVLSKLEEAGIPPSEETDRATLLRRVFFTLIGIPPSVEELERFLADPAPTRDALASIVDRLLSSQHFGERWGRHWLDVVRFAQSSGGGRTLLFPDAWRYRDFVIDAFNADMPYDQFLTEQLAGDLVAAKLPDHAWQQRRRMLIATSFLLLGPTNYELQDKDILEMDIIDEQLDTIGKAFLGQTIGCARCHDHKFDPIPTQDYYAMAGIFKSTQSVVHNNVSTWRTGRLPVPNDKRQTLERTDRQRKVLKQQIASTKKEIKRLQSNKDPTETVAAENLKAFETQLRVLEKTAPQWPQAMMVADSPSPEDIPIAVRGVAHNRGRMTKRGVLRVAIPHEFPSIHATSSGRLELAQWITSANHPLTPRVIVNRVWGWIFGEGLVRTVDNFGATGELPSHPDLLDHLANEFVADGQSIKRLIRRLLLSRVYRTSSNVGPTGFKNDPSNRLLWRAARQHLDAESLRDTLLRLSGSLDLTAGGPNLRSGTKIEYNYRFDSTRRSVYVPVFRNTLPPLFATFDFADPNIQIGKRTQSIIAPQALLLMNSPFVINQCRAAGRQIAADSRNNAIRTDHCFKQVLGRPPSAAELQLARDFLGAQPDASRWGLLYQSLIQSLDFRYIH